MTSYSAGHEQSLDSGQLGTHRVDRSRRRHSPTRPNRPQARRLRSARVCGPTPALRLASSSGYTIGPHRCRPVTCRNSYAHAYVSHRICRRSVRCRTPLATLVHLEVGHRDPGTDAGDGGLRWPPLRGSAPGDHRRIGDRGAIVEDRLVHVPLRDSDTVSLNLSGRHCLGAHSRARRP